jgi:hypothetical protein
MKMNLSMLILIEIFELNRPQSWPEGLGTGWTWFDVNELTAWFSADIDA